MTRVSSTESRTLFENAGIMAVSSRGEMAISIDCDHIRHPCAGTLARMPLEGGVARDVFHGAVSADWSPDGTELAVATVAHLEYPMGKRLFEAAPAGFLSSIRISPDGQLVALLDHPRRDSLRGILTVVDRAGRKTILTKEWAGLGPLLWSPTGKEVFFSRWGSREIWGASLSGRTRRASWIPGLDDVSQAGLFLDSTAADDYRSVILARVPDRRDERNLSWLARSVAMDLTDDGRLLLFYEEGRDSDRSQKEVFTTYLRFTEGPDVIRLGDGRALAFSPDAEWALIARESPEPHLVLLPAGAGEPKRLAGNLYARRGTFFPDGKRILFISDSDPSKVLSYIQDVEGGPPTPFGDPGFRAMVVSPDGRTVAGLRGTEGEPYFYPADGQGPPRPIPGALPREPLVQWSSDGKAVYAWGAEPRSLIVYRVDLATGRRERWKTLGPPDTTGLLRYGPHLRGQGLSITPDGKYYAYTYFTATNRLELVEGPADWWK
jgi:Tol biopolymer transport system component